jgi:Tfp pilus assembly protein PilN
MNALELADLLETTESTNNQAATMLRQQQAEIDAAMELIKKFQEEREALKEQLEDCTCQGGHSEAYLKAKGKLK